MRRPASQTSRNRKRELSLKLAILARRMRMHFDESVQRAGAPRAHWPLIAAVARIPGATQKSVAQVLQISEVSAGRLIDKLCQENLLQRTANSEDRRAYCVSLTDRAGPLLEEIDAIAAACEARAFEGLSEGDLEALQRILGVIERNISPEANGDEGRRDGRTPYPRSAKQPPDACRTA